MWATLIILALVVVEFLFMFLFKSRGESSPFNLRMFLIQIGITIVSIIVVFLVFFIARRIF